MINEKKDAPTIDPDCVNENYPNQMQQPGAIEFDSTVSRVTSQEKEALLKYFTDNKGKRLWRIVAGILFSLLTLILFFLFFIFLFSKKIITEENVLYIAISIIIVWIVLTVAIFRWIAQISNRTIQKFEYKNLVMYISTDFNRTPNSPVFEEIHVWEYVSDRLEHVTYPVYGNIIFPNGVQTGDLIYKYSNNLDNDRHTFIYFVSKNIYPIQ
jgi:ABC-type multidrug transport system fused ATPase/permease subunit